MKVFINPGHMPGVDPGACGNGLQEADVVLNIGRILERYLERAGHEVKLLQSDNLCGESPAYTNVCKTANEWGADLFVSIHCNAVGDSSANGTEVFVYSGSSSVVDVAQRIHDNITNRSRFRKRGVKVNPKLIVLKHTTMPAVLVECGFISNPSDAYILSNEQDIIAMAIADAIGG